MPKILPPRPPARPPDPAPLLRLCRIAGFRGALGAFYRCPLCLGVPREGDARRRDTLLIHLDLQNGAVARCHGCGFAGTALTLLARVTKDSWAEIRRALEDAGVYGGDPVPEECLEREIRWDKFAVLFAEAQAGYRRRLILATAHPQFGEVGIAAGANLDAVLPGLRLRKKWGNGFFLVELLRSLSGLPLAAVVKKMKTGHEVARFWFHPAEPVEVLAADWAIYRDWSRSATVCTDLSVAAALQEGYAESDPDGSPPVLWAANCTAPIRDGLPWKEVCYAPGERESEDFALAFVQGNTRVRVGGEDAVSVIATRIATGEGDPSRQLDAVLAKRWVPEEAARRLTRAVADLIGETFEGMLGRSGLSENVLSCRASGFSYIARNGIYLKRREGASAGWSPCSNFSIRLEESFSEGGEATHRMRLHLGGKTVAFTAAQKDFDCGRRLMELATTGAVEAGLPWPNMPEPKDVARLPGIVKATSLSRIAIPPPDAGGFCGGRFHGANFTVSPSGIRFWRAGHGGWNQKPRGARRRIT